MIVARYDNITVKGSVQKLDSGFLRVPVTATRTGVFSYRKKDGTIRRELRHPDEVFKADSLQSLAGVPLTNRHPTEPVTSANVRKYIVGMVGDNVQRRDDKFVDTAVTIMDEKMITGVEKDGLREVSCGYKCDVIEQSGVFNGEHYDAVQKDIHYNHLAVVDSGRLGPEARLHLDSDDAAELVEDGNSNPDPINHKPNGGVRMLVDGIDFKVDDNTASTGIMAALKKRDDVIAQLKTDAATATTESTKKLDGLQAKFDQAETDITKLKKDADDAPKTADLVKARVTLVSAATPHLDEETVAKLDGMTDRDVKVAVISSSVENFDAKEKSDDYVQARYDGIIESGTENTDDDDGAGAGGGENKLDSALRKRQKQKADDNKNKTPDDIRNDSMRNDQEAWKRPLSSTTRAAGGN